jgi:hypothetical protein
VISYYGVHQFPGSDDGIHRTRINAKRASDTGVFINPNTVGDHGMVIFGIDLITFRFEKLTKLDQYLLASRRTAVTCGGMITHGLSIGGTGGITATLTLELW